MLQRQLMKNSKSKQIFLLRNLLGILTPEEINNLTTQYCGERRVSLVDLTAFDLMGRPLPEKELNKKEKIMAGGPKGPEQEEKAKILPFTKETEENKSVLPLRAGTNCAKVLAKGLKSGGGSIMGGKNPAPREDEITVIKEKKAASIFILEEKERLCESRRKLQSREVMDTYKNVSMMNIEREKRDNKDNSLEKKKRMRSISHSGFLVNKKQA